MIRHAPIATTCALVIALAMAGCDRAANAPAPAVMAPIENGQGAVEWEGVQPCADCIAIQTRLQLSREGDTQAFVLTEIYMAERPVRFVTQGQWHREGQQLALQADDGGQLRYAFRDNGELQPRDLSGKRLPGSDGDGVLLPLVESVAR